MSVFRGSIVEYPGVVVDHYVPANCERGRIFFLSHCHKDHMTGLGSRALLDALRRRCTFLHCSEVTRALLLHYTEFRDLIPFLKALPMEEPVSIKLEPTLDAPEMNFTVTLLPAGHCPGSAMFLFQGITGTVLYTGDFRLSVDEAKRIQPLHPGGQLLNVTTLYLDTTFCSPIASDIPDRETSRQFIVSCVTDWLARSPQNAVLLQCSMFGYEHVFMGVSQKLCTKIHVGSWRHDVYSEIPAVHECLTSDGQSTRIHCCSYRKGQQRTFGLPCGSKGPNGHPFHVLTIKPSTQWFLSLNSFLPKQNMYRVIHSMHSSFNEICAFVAYIRPRQIVPCVVPSGDSALTDVHARLKVFLSGSLRQLSPSATDNQETVVDVICRGKEEGEEEGEEERGNCSSESDPDWQGQREEDVNEDEKWGSKQKCDSSPLVLPSMLIGDGEDHSPSSSIDGQDSVGTGGTVGSLEQTPIDLYLSGDSASSQGVDHENPVTAGGGGKVEEGVVKGTGCGHSDGISSKLGIPADASSGKIKVPADDSSAGKPVVPAGDSSAGKPVVPAGDSSAGKPVVPAGDSSAGKPVVPAGDSSAGKPVVPAGDSSAGKPVVPAGDSSAGKPVVPAGDSSAGKPVVPAGDSSAGKPVVPAGDSSAGKPVVPAGDSSAGKPVVPAGDSSAGKPVVAAGDSKESIDVKADAICTGPQSLAQNLVQATNGMKEHSLDLCAEDENMVVLLEQPYHHQRRRSSVEVRGYNDSRCLEPRGKRLRLSCPGSREVPMCPAPYSQIPSSVASVSDASSWVQSSGISQPPVDSQLRPSLLSNIRTTKAIVFIDLTKDESESDESVVLCRVAQYEDDPDNVIVLSGSSSTSAQLASVHGKEEDNLSDDGLPSPECLGYLPPSPGREGVSSILKRKALGF